MELNVKHQRVYQGIKGFSVIGFLITIYATYIHFSTTNSVLCNLNAQFNCDIVNKGIYSEVFGVPVAILGMLGYVWFFTLATEMLSRPQRRTKLILAASIAFAAGFSLHLAWISSVLLATWCLVCIASYICTFAIFGLFAWREI
jgi:uncharacterized membrane protein